MDWVECFANKTIETQAFEFNVLLLNFYSNYTPNKIILCGAMYYEKDPLWMSDVIRTWGLN